MNNFLYNHRDRFRGIALLEGISYVLLLFVAMPLKYIWQMPAAVRAVGMAHGVLFVVYVLALLLAATERKWSVGKSAKLFIASLVPFGAFVADKWVMEENTK